MHQHCTVCKTTATSSHLFACGSCNLVLYCGEKCADIDWSEYHYVDHTNGMHDADLVLPPSNTRQGSVWLGGIVALKNENVMRRIDAVVSALHVDQVQQCALDALIGAERAHMRVSVWDDPEEADTLAAHFDEVADFIDAQIEVGNNVLVHCAAGISRSTTLVLYYMLKYRGYKTVDDSLAKVREQRLDANPNKGFLAKLRL